MHPKALAALNTLTLLALAPLALAQSSSSLNTKTSTDMAGMSMAGMSMDSTASATSGAAVVTMMWDNPPSGTAQATAASGTMEAGMMMSDGTMEAGMTMSDGTVMTGTDMSMSGMMMTGTAMAGMEGMNMSSAGRLEVIGGKGGMMSVGMLVISLGAGAGFVLGML